MDEEIHPVARTLVDAKFADPLADRFDITGQPMASRWMRPAILALAWLSFRTASQALNFGSSMISSMSTCSSWATTMLSWITRSELKRGQMGFVSTDGFGGIQERFGAGGD